MPLKDLKEELEEEGLSEYIPPERIREIIQKADTDGDKQIKLGEFIRLVFAS